MLTFSSVYDGPADGCIADRMKSEKSLFDIGLFVRIY